MVTLERKMMPRIFKSVPAALFFMGTLVSALAQKDPLQGLWEGKVKSQQGDFPAKLTLRKDGASYGGTVSGPTPNSEMKFKEVILDGNKVNTKVDIATPQGTITAVIKFTLKGESLKGKGEANLGQQVFVFDYEFKRVSEEVAAPVEALSAPAKPQVGQGSPEEVNEFSKL